MALVLAGFLVVQTFSYSRCCCGPACTHQDVAGPCEACRTVEPGDPDRSEFPCVHFHPSRELESRKLELVALDGPWPGIALPLAPSPGGPPVIRVFEAREGSRRRHLVLSVLLI